MYRRVMAVSGHSDVPSQLPRRKIVLVGSPPKWAVMACPCGHGHRIDLNLAHGDRARWSVESHKRPWISPSVDIKNPARRCHFWLRDGQIHWVTKPRREVHST
ncbi:MAG: DUF6527 family protein [Acidimicrobiales bacterium]